MKRVLLALLGIFSLFSSPAQTRKYDIFRPNAWVDSVLSTMSVEEKIGQLFMVAAFTSKDKSNIPQLQYLIQHYHIGGLIFFRGGPGREVIATNYLQSISKLPLLVGIDAEWGLSMRLDSTQNYGYQMSIAACNDDSIVYKMGHEMALECRRIGAQINFAPVIDINNNPLNPVIHMRSFGENKEMVTRKGLMYMYGLQDEHILAVAKHFPGHGNTDVDSHLDLPVQNQSRISIDTLELYPFKRLFKEGVGGVMTAHLHIPAYDSTKNIGASLSPAVTTGLLRWDLNYKGIAFSDALNMGGVSKYYAPGELEMKALLAGNDVLLYSENIPRAMAYIRHELDSGCIDIDFIDAKVRRILAVKKWVGLNKCVNTADDEVSRDLNTPKARLLKETITEEAITLVRNKKGLIPIKNLESIRIASVGFGTREQMPFQDMVQMYSRASVFDVSMFAKDSIWMKLKDTLRSYDLVIFSMHNLSNKNTGTYGLTDKTINFINMMQKEKNCILVSFGSPYALSRFPGYDHILCAYQDDVGFQYAAAEALFGASPIKGKMPVTSSAEYAIGSGLNSSQVLRMDYTEPEGAGMSSTRLVKIDSIVQYALRQEAMPGCQVLVARDNKVVYYKSFGYHAYDKKNTVENNDLYDIASVTKVAATTLVAMSLYESGKLNINSTLGTYLPELAGSNKAGLQLREIMAHQAGLKEWIPFYKKTLLPNGMPDTLLYCDVPNKTYSLRVADKLYLNHNYKDSIYKIIDSTTLQNRGQYHYSDLGFIYMQRVIERISGKPLNVLADSLFYKPLGLATMTFRPREKFGLHRLIPTENDTVFRHQLILGDVHDPAAAMFGGVSGHAGLFSDANDLAIIMQMLLNGGSYGGKRYLLPSTVQLFTSPVFETSRRALGWDRPELRFPNGPTSSLASPQSFGHQGFTGTCIWSDPKYKLTYIFLSNRINPSAENHRLVDMSIRTRIQDEIYKAILK
jgi:beta-N-acetylhexosaminidase